MSKKPSNNRSPAWATKFLHWFCKGELIEEIEGDILEEYHEFKDKKKRWIANLFYIYSVFTFLRPFAVKKIALTTTQNNRIMYTNYLKVAFRNVRKDRVNSFISIAGLILAFTSSMLIYRVVQHETNYDTFHEKSDQIYRMVLEAKRDDSWKTYPMVGPPVGPAIQEYYPEIKKAVRLRYTPTRIFSTSDNEKQFFEEKIFYTDPSIFEIFTYPFLMGNPNSALSKNTNVVITHEVAQKYFGSADPMGQTLLLDNDIPFIVSGVLAPIPENTHFKFDFLLPFEAFKVPPGYPVTLDDFGWTSFHTYVLLEKHANPNSLVEKFSDFAGTHFDEERIKRLKYGLQPLRDIYFGDVKNENIASGNKSYVIILSSIGVLLLLLAAFNFTNISAAKSLSRAKETGLRKTLGSTKTALIHRYLSEPLIINIIAVVLSLLITPYLLIQVNNIFNISISWDRGYWFELGAIFLGIGIIIGILSGLYPAFIMSSFKPASILRGSYSRSKGGSNLQKILVTVQYAITSFLLIGSFIISSQVDFLQKQNLGFESDELLLLRIPGEELNAKYLTIKNLMNSNSRVKGISVGGGRMDGENGNVPIMAEGQLEAKNLPIDAVKEDFFSTIGTPVLAGREFSFQHPSDSIDGVIINREAARYFDWSPEEAIGKKITVGNLVDGHIIGVVENFHNTSLHTAINPLVICYPAGLLEDIYIRVAPGNASELIEGLRLSWNEIAPDIPFDFVFMNQHLQSLYNKDIQFSKMVKLFAILTIFISILGLYGLVSLISEQRLKEISIRKVFGAPFAQLILSLSKSFFVLIIIANIIAWPFAYLISKSWISEFAYRININLMFFVSALMITLLVSGITLFIQSRKVAILSPAKTLKHE